MDVALADCIADAIDKSSTVSQLTRGGLNWRYVRDIELRIAKEVDHEQEPKGPAIRRRPCRSRGSPGGCEVRHAAAHCPGSGVIGGLNFT
jgi:hypothetical protein